MKFSIDKILATFGNMRAMERTHVDNYTEDILNSISDKAFAVSQQNVMYATTKELGGYYYLKTIIVGAFKIKTFKGARLILSSPEFELEFKTDMDEFESDYSNISNRFITRVDFQIEENDLNKINSESLNTLTLKAKNTTFFLRQ